MLTFVRKMTLFPEELSESDVAQLRDLGISDAEITDAVSVAALLNVVDRLADSLGFTLLQEGQRATFGRLLYRVGYRLNYLTAYPGGRPWGRRPASWRGSSNPA